MKWLIVIGAIALIGIIGFFILANDSENVSIPIEKAFPGSDIQLKDVRTGENFKIEDFRGNPVLVESFAVWCPICTKQQKEIKKLHDELGDSFVSISLDTDPNEDDDRIKEHLERNDFDWYYSVSPPNLTRLLIDNYGQGIANAPSAPVILICDDGKSKLLGSGVKSSDELKREIESCKK